MATDTKLEMGVLEKLGEKFSNFGDGAVKFMTRLFGSSNERFVRKVGYVASRDPNVPHTVIPGSWLARVNEFEPTMAALSDAELRDLSVKFRERLKAGASMDDLLPEAFAACREAAKRTKAMRHYDVQIVGGVALHRTTSRDGDRRREDARRHPAAFLNGLTGAGSTSSR